MLSTMNNQNISSLIVTHNRPLRMLIMKLVCMSRNLYRCYEFKKYRWQNCCVLKLELFPNNTFILTLLHPGELDEREEKAYHYWSNQSSQLTFDSIYGTRTYHAMTEPLTGVFDSNNSIKYNTTFYLVRHGQAKYYTTNCITKKIKTTNSKHLTIEGQHMTRRAGQAIYTDLQKTQSKLDYCYVSDVIRTQETFANLLKAMTIDCFQFHNSEYMLNVFILPRYRTLQYDKTGNYFQNQYFWPVFPNCLKYEVDECEYIFNKAESNENRLTHNSNCTMVSVNINWELYYQSYQKHSFKRPILEEVIFGKIHLEKRYSRRKPKYNKISRRPFKTHIILSSQ
jgi:broad specificity phosphatase PhoE